MNAENPLVPLAMIRRMLRVNSNSIEGRSSRPVATRCGRDRRSGNTSGVNVLVAGLRRPQAFQPYRVAGKMANGGARVRGLLGIMAAVALAVMSLGGIGGVAIAAPAGSITGSVHADNERAIERAYVAAYDWNTNTIEGEAYTIADGTYSITGLRSGSYRVTAVKTGYLPEYWEEATTHGAADPVTVTDPSATSHVDFTLTPGRSISGYVYRDDGTTPIQTAAVVAYEGVTEPGTWKLLAYGYSGADGSYSITTGTGSGSYLVMARGVGYAAEYYNNVSSQEAATPVAVTDKNDATGINFTLTQIGYISGRVYQADGVTPLGGAVVVAYDSATGAWKDSNYSGPGDGYYYINLAPGTYRLRAEASGYMTEWYLNADTFGTATPVAVVGLKEKTGVNFTLEPGLAVTTNQATNLTTNSARLNGDLTSLGTESRVTVSFEWGTTRGGPYPNSTAKQTRTSKGAFYASLTGLTSGTTYYYKAKAVGDEDTVYGMEKSFTTIDDTPPVISLVKSDNITGSRAAITWTTNEAATTQVQYGMTAAYGSFSTLDTKLVTSHSANLKGLSANKTYHYRVISKDASNNEAVSADYTFTTAARSAGMPIWAWVVIGIAAVAVVGAMAYFAFVRSAATGHKTE